MTDGAITVLGAGNWGTTLACILGEKGLPVRLWDRDPDRANRMEMERVNEEYLPGRKLPDSISVGSDLSTLSLGSSIVLIAIPVPAIRAVLHAHRHVFLKSQCFASASKGIENKSGMRVTEIIIDELGRGMEERIAVLSGPNLAPEIANRLPSSCVVASPSDEVCTTLQEAFSTDYFRMYTSSDVVGVEIGGALKNILAIASGIVDELELGNNAKGALLTRGLAEITRFGTHLGAKPMTFLGLSGMGDLITTCSSPISRNHKVGCLLARGMNLEAIKTSMSMTAEGVNTTRSVVELARKLEIEMPISEQVYSMLFENKEPSEAIRELMLRKLKSEEIS